jgi:hypothetical protein
MAANPITDYDRRIVREMWTADYSVEEIAFRLHRATGTIQYIAASMRLGPKPIKAHLSVWTEPMVEALRVAWFEGQSATQVATTINAAFGVRLTRNATIGKIHRMGFIRSDEISDLNKTYNGADKLIAARKANAEKAEARKVKRGVTLMGKPKHALTAAPNPKASFATDDNVREAWVIVTDAAWDVLPGTEPKTLLNRRNFGECKYPVGMNEPEQRFCCTKTDQTYCDAHRKIMYRPPGSIDRDDLRLQRLLRSFGR